MQSPSDTTPIFNKQQIIKPITESPGNNLPKTANLKERTLDEEKKKTDEALKRIFAKYKAERATNKKKRNFI